MLIINTKSKPEDENLKSTPRLFSLDEDAIRFIRMYPSILVQPATQQATDNFININTSTPPSPTLHASHPGLPAHSTT